MAGWNRRPFLASLCACLMPLLVSTLRLDAAPKEPETPATWPQAYSVQRDSGSGLLTLSTPYYQVQHDLKRGGAISSIRLAHGRATNLLVQPIAARVRDDQGAVFTELPDSAPRVTQRRDQLTEIVSVESRLLDAQGRVSALRLKTDFEYHWGYIRVHREFVLPSGTFQARELCALSTVLASSLSDFGYRDGRTEQEGEPPFSFGSCHWGKLKIQSPSNPVLNLSQLPRYVMFADAGVEGLEWFMSSSLSQWDLQLTGRRGQGRCLLESSQEPSGFAFSLSPFQSTNASISMTNTCAFDFYLGLPISEGHANKPWFHSSFNRNRGNWVTPEQVQSWARQGIQTVHCHNDGDAYGDGLFWHDGSYPPYPDMENYDKVIAECHKAGIRVATYFSNKELHPSTKEFQEHGVDWARMDLKGNLQHNFLREKSEFGAQMCLRSGWLKFLEFSIDRVLTNHALDGVYYDWNVPLLCSNPRHGNKAAGPAEAAHWDVDELLQLMEWTRNRVGPKGLVILHNTTTPMFAMENFANYIVGNEWGYGKWVNDAPALQDLPLEWRLAGARSRGVISYGQIAGDAPRRLHRLFAIEALLNGATPWPASPETFELFPILKPVGEVETCRFADWRNQAVALEGTRCASAIYSRPGESFILLANMTNVAQDVQCTIHPDRLPYPMAAPTAATLHRLGSNNPPAQAAPSAVDVRELTGSGARVSIPADSVILLQMCDRKEK